MGNEHSVEEGEEDALEETKVEPWAKGRDRGQSRSRSASPQKKRHQSTTAQHQQQKQSVKAHPPETRQGEENDDDDEEEDEWLQGTVAAAVAGKGKKKGGGGGGKKKGAKAGGGGAKGWSLPADGSARAPTEGSEKKQPAAAPSTPVPSTPPKPKAAPVAAAAAAAASPVRRSTSGKAVRWGGVVVQTFLRRPSPDSVPPSGAWPLGLGEADGEGPGLTASVDEYEAAKAEEMERRIQELPKRLRKVGGWVGLKGWGLDDGVVCLFVCLFVVCAASGGSPLTH